MDIQLTYTPSEGERMNDQRLLQKLFPTKPLYLFLSVSAILLVFMGARHLTAPSSKSLICMGASVLCLLLGGVVLRSTLKSRPRAEQALLAGVGKTHHLHFTDTTVTVERAGSPAVVYPRRALVGQYHTDRAYVFCFARHSIMEPVVLCITPENIDALNHIVQSNINCGIKLKKLKVK